MGAPEKGTSCERQIAAKRPVALAVSRLPLYFGSLERVAFKRAHGFRKTPEAAFASQMRSGVFLNSIQRDMLQIESKWAGEET
ncbi:hypothetical protein DCO57_00345 [Labrenzia sp. 011]|nr:hypothetical protein DCO57_00345 [Labrenzia sp. 011]